VTEVTNWRCVILAGSRGPDDPMSKHFGVAHKCMINIAGKPMLEWVLQALRGTAIDKPFVIVIDDVNAVPAGRDTKTISAENSAPASAIAALSHLRSYPVLITTGDHPLLSPAMIAHVVKQAESARADVLVGLATAETIQATYPETRRTYFNLGGTRVSGCNLFAITSVHGLKMLERWRELERDRKKPWKLVSAFGVTPVVQYALGLLTPERAFERVSKSLGITVKPVFMPFAEAAIDVDKPADHALAERILLRRSAPA
jgi:GTP:adenosylcobinamide-phosphate guanylyltransferase